jgi:hypothetical protein
VPVFAGRPLLQRQAKQGGGIADVHGVPQVRAVSGVAGEALHRENATLAISDDDADDVSPYGDRFSNGANIFPRMLFF